jgi:DNA helicase-2/ATP-dependent DNA helicase PcrA
MNILFIGILLFVVVSIHISISLMKKKKRDKRYVQEFVKAYEDGLVIFDTETTGLDVMNDDIIQIAALHLKKGKVIRTFNVFLKLNQGKSIPLTFGNYNNPMVEEYEKLENTKFDRDKGLLLFLEFIGNMPLLAHNIKFDSNIFDNNLKHDANIDSFKEEHTVYIDSITLAKIVFPDLPSYKLGNIVKRLGIGDDSIVYHDARGDVKATKLLIDYC